MRFFFLQLLILFTSCSKAEIKTKKATLPVVFDSMARGKILAKAQVLICLTNKKKNYHLLALSRRDPASITQVHQVIFPTKIYYQWSNKFKTCVPCTHANQIGAIANTPKDISYLEGKELALK